MKRFKNLIDSFGIGFIFIIICVIFSLLSDQFLSSGNFSQILMQTSINIIIAVGMTFVISAAEIDLSVGSLAGVCAVITAYLLQVNPETGMNFPMMAASLVLRPFPDLFPWVVSWWIISGTIFIVLALLPGIIGGFLAGLIVVRFSVPSFIVTLGFMMIYRGFSLYLTDAQQISGLIPSFGKLNTPFITIMGFGGVYYSALIAVIIVIIGAFYLNRSRFGRYVLAIGGNPQASYLSGLPVGKIRVLVFMVSGFCVAVASILQSSRLLIGDPNTGEGYELDAIAAVIIGGTSLLGGRGTIIGTLFGALIIQVLRNGLVLLDVQSHIQRMVIGIIIILAVLMDYYRRKVYSLE